MLNGLFQVSDMLNGKVQNVYRLPPPGSCSVNESGDPVNLRIPPTEKPTISQVRSQSPLRNVMFNIVIHKNTSHFFVVAWFI